MKCYHLFVKFSHLQENDLDFWLSEKDAASTKKEEPTPEVKVTPVQDITSEEEEIVKKEITVIYHLKILT